MRGGVAVLCVSLVGCSAEGGFDGPSQTVDARAESSATDVGGEASTVDSSTVDSSVVDAAETGLPDATPESDAPADASPHSCPAASASSDCSPGTGTGEGDQCHDGPSCFLSFVQKAVNDQVSVHPDWFDFTGPSGCPVIKDVDTFLDAVVAEVASHDLCVVRDPNAPGEEISVKKDNAFTENFDIVSSAGCARSGAAIYTGYCAPAWW